MELFGLLYCESLQKEIEESLSKEDFPLLISRSFTRHCSHKDKAHDPVKEPLLELLQECNRIIILGCGCMHKLSLPELPDDVEVVTPDLFRDILLPESLVDEKRQQGAYCMAPDNLLHHAQFFQCQGFDDTTIREFFSESVRSVLLADTLTTDISDEFIQEFSRRHQVPVTVIPVGTTPIRQYLKGEYLGWLVDRERDEYKKTLAEAHKKTADYVMMVDLLGGITMAKQEHEVIRIIFDLFSLLFSPREINFLPVTDGRTGTCISHTGRPVQINDEISRFLSGHDDYSLTRTGEGFCLRIRRDNSTLGILYLEGLAMPEYLQNYLDPGLFIARVCGLAITNARIYEQLNDSIEALNNEIAKRKTIELALRESEEHYRSLFENMLEGFAYCQILYDADNYPADWIYLNVNESFDRLTGLTGVKGKRATEVFPGIRERSPELFEIYSRVARTGIPETFETFFSHLNIWLRISVYQPKEEHFVAVFENITDRKQAEEELKKLVRDTETILENVPSMILFKDTQNRYIKVNPAAAKMIGKPVHEMEGKTYSELFPHHADDYANNDLMVIQSKEPKLGILEDIITPRGDYRWVLTDTVPMKDDNDEVIGLLVVSTDITETKRAKDAVSHANHKLQLLSGITRHDIGNELQILFGYLELAEMESMSKEVLEYFTYINEAAHHIERQIAFTRDYQDIGVNTPVWQELGEIIRQALQSIQISPIQVDIDISGIEIYADPLIVKVFFNLMDNARRYGDKITRIRFSGQTRGKEYVIICEDDGVGIPEEYKLKIFKREYFKHTGFGLNLSREILDITRITITETGTPGIGARFEMNVPEATWRFCKKQG